MSHVIEQIQKHAIVAVAMLLIFLVMMLLFARRVRRDRKSVRDVTSIDQGPCD